jgi:hypothetical protein
VKLFLSIKGGINMKKMSLFFMLLTIFLAASLTNALTIDIAPDGSPPAGYLPLSLFSVAPIAGMGDESILNYNVPSFSYAGETWNKLGVVSNGYLVVGGGTNADVAFVNQQFPNSVLPNNVLAPFWTNLNPAFGGAVRIAILTDGVNNWIVVDWDAVQNYSDRLPNSFEVWLRTGGVVEDITFVYGAVTSGDLGLLTVGAEDKTGTVGDNYYYSLGVHNGSGTLPIARTELRVTTSGPPVGEVPEPSTMLLLGSGLIGLAGYGRRKFFKK